MDFKQKIAFAVQRINNSIAGVGNRRPVQGDAIAMPFLQVTAQLVEALTAIAAEIEDLRDTVETLEERVRKLDKN
jgi:phage shock protein A